MSSDVSGSTLLNRSSGIQIVHCPVSGLKLVDCVQNVVWNKDLITQEVLIAILSYAVHPKTFDDIVSFLLEHFDYPEEVITVTVQETVNADILVPVSNDMVFEKGYVDWIKSGWEDAFYFHANTNNLKKLDYFDDPRDEKDISMMVSYLEKEPHPDNYKEIGATKRIVMDKPYPGTIKHQSFDQVMGLGFAKKQVDKKISREEFDWFMYLAFGQTHATHMHVTGFHVAKTSPSGGSRHPTEIYPLILDVEGIEPGLYHYSVRSHALELITTEGLDEFLEKDVLIYRRGQNRLPKVVFIMTCIFERSMFRYRESRSYRVMNFDIGHLNATSFLLASSLGWTIFSYYSMNESNVAKKLKLNDIHESPMTILTLE